MESCVEEPPLVRALLEALARVLELGSGRWTCELVFEDGRLVKVYRHEGPLGAREVEERFGGNR